MKKFRNLLVAEKLLLIFLNLKTEIIFKIYDHYEDNRANLKSFRINLIDSIKNELKHYFPTEDFS
jgi:hypothetical protein